MSEKTEEMKICLLKIVSGRAEGVKPVPLFDLWRTGYVDITPSEKGWAAVKEWRET